jgi:hypothetical protein
VKRNRDTRPIHEQLAGAERGLQQLKVTRNRDDRRVMLGCLLFDLVAIEKAVARDGCSAAERARLETLARRAWEMQRHIGPPIEDPSSSFIVTTRVRNPAQSSTAFRGRARYLPPQADYWTSRGIPARIAGFLIQAGIKTLDDLARMTRKEFFLGRGLGENALVQCEALLGRPLASPEEDWLQAGCPRWLLARKLVRAKILTVADLWQKDEKELSAAGLSRREIEHCNRMSRKAKRKAERA